MVELSSIPHAHFTKLKLIQIQKAFQPTRKSSRTDLDRDLATRQNFLIPDSVASYFCSITLKSTEFSTEHQLQMRSFWNGQTIVTFEYTNRRDEEQLQFHEKHHLFNRKKAPCIANILDMSTELMPLYSLSSPLASKVNSVVHFYWHTCPVCLCYLFLSDALG